jgi:hypothetical protein
MPLKSEKTTKRRSPVREFFQWVFDLSLVGIIIWFFSNPQNTAQFWSTISQFFAFSVAQASKFLPGQSDSVEPSTTKTPERAKPSMADQKTSAPPPFFVPPPLPTATELNKEVPGDCLPPEIRSREDAEFTEKLFYQPPPLPKLAKTRKGHGKPIQFAKKKVKGIPLYQITIDLDDPDCYIVVRLPKKAEIANSPTFSIGHESFDSLVKRYPAAALVNGTFFSKDEQERVMGNLVSEGKFLKYSQWENYGTTLSLSKGDYPEMVTARAEGKPHWDEQWFSITCGPRLLKGGEIWLNPELEGFTDSHVLGAGPRCALGFPKSRKKLYLVSFLRGLTLQEEAQLMKELGCVEAMNLDGGASKAMAENQSIVMEPGRGLTNVIVVYDCKNKAPASVITAWQNFQKDSSKATFPKALESAP